MKKLQVIFLTLFLTTLSISTKASHEFEWDAQSRYEYNLKYKSQLDEVKQFFLFVTGIRVTTQVVDMDNFPLNSGVVAYCNPKNRDIPSYISFNHNLLKQYTKDQIFQVILHEFVHCEYSIGHIQIPGNFMNDGGDPTLTKDQVKAQFKLYHEWYLDNYEVITAVK